MNCMTLTEIHDTLRNLPVSPGTDLDPSYGYDGVWALTIRVSGFQFTLKQHPTVTVTVYEALGTPESSAWADLARMDTATHGGLFRAFYGHGSRGKMIAEQIELAALAVAAGEGPIYGHTT